MEAQIGSHALPSPIALTVALSVRPTETYAYQSKAHSLMS
jgi:hypothetical protein